MMVLKVLFCFTMVVVLFATIIENSAVSSTHAVYYNSTIYFGGCARGKTMRPYLSQLLTNIKMISQFWSDFRLCVYADDEGVEILKGLHSTKIDIISESEYGMIKTLDPNVEDEPVDPEVLKFRTGRLSRGRNSCLNLVRAMVDKQNQSWDDTIFVNIDLDDINQYPFHTDVFKNALLPENLKEWDALSFNRDPYYDYWALRYSGYDKNIFVHGGKDGWWKFTVHKEFGEFVLNPSPLKWFPVYSAFNGIAFYKLNYTRHCRFNGEHAWDDAATVNHTYQEDCEHVAFQKCMGNKNNAKVVIFHEQYESEKERFQPEELIDVSNF